MSDLIPFADHGTLVTALPFAGPALLVICGLVALVVRDRLSSGKPPGSRDG